MNERINEWNKVAKVYAEVEATSQYSNFCRQFIDTYFNNIKGLKILDAGCGDGEYTHLLAEKSENIIGCDGALEMLKISKSKYPSLQFDLVDLSDALPYEDSEFDIVICNLVLMDIDPIENIISEFHRILKENGVFFFSILHPAFYQGQWGKDNKGIISSKNLTGYITPMAVQQNFWGTTMHYHRPISYYFNMICSKGFSLKTMSEPKVYEETKISDIPLYLFAEFIKN